MKRTGVIALGLLTIAGCSTSETRREATPQDKERWHQHDMNAKRLLIKRTSFTRSGGFAGTLTQIDITPAGQYHWSVKQGGNGHMGDGQLNETEMRELVDAFNRFDQYASEYKAPDSTADDFQLILKHGEKTVTASDASPELPVAFIKLVNVLVEKAGPR